MARSSRNTGRCKVSAIIAFYILFWLALGFQIVVLANTHLHTWFKTIMSGLPMAVLLILYADRLNIGFLKTVVFFVLAFVPFASTLTFFYYEFRFRSVPENKPGISPLKEKTAASRDAPEIHLSLETRRRPRRSRDIVEVDLTTKRPSSSETVGEDILIVRAQSLISEVFYVLSAKGNVGKPVHVDADKWRNSFVAISVVTAASSLPLHIRREFILVIQTSLGNHERKLIKSIADCHRFYGEYSDNVPGEYGPKRHSDLMAAWLANWLLNRKFENINELRELRELTAELDLRFARWWDIQSGTA